ncbi:ribulose-1,5-biphosphate synthetase [Planctomycetes bacterium Pan216]|uniref:Ribulose-1,5-biphosphate synthetase n=2 Tax=Kolteria novifilia TaxID=2527975 RepID=A0A518B4Z3_9BACT|nr:ribulose-1,5-biphosphate synthetase [Planctomycetes bacterium Pan216]
MAGELTRRQMIGASAGVLGAGSLAIGEESKGDTVTEPERQIPVNTDADVIVCGGGPAGVAAAIAAARTGAKVRLFELHGCLGGVWTSGALSFVIDADKPGFNKELVTRLDKYDARANRGVKNYMYDVEAMKIVLEDLCKQLGIKTQLHTRAVGVLKDDSKRMTTLLTESKAGRQAWQAPVFIDATGDGDVGALAGCRWEVGRDKDCPCQPMSLMGFITADPEVLADYTNLKGSGKNKDRFREEIEKAGMEPTYGKPTLWHMEGPIAAVMLNHEYGIKPFDAEAISDATINARRELFEVARALNKLGGKWDGTRLIATAEQIGIRDGRRIRGRYFVTVDDVIKGARHQDAICRSTFSVDVHATSMENNRKSAYSNHGIKAKAFDIPLRALIAADVDGLMLAGRCISGDFLSHASYRVTGNSVAMGEAAGVTSALAARSKRMPHEVAYSELETELQRVRNLG